MLAVKLPLRRHLVVADCYHVTMCPCYRFTSSSRCHSLWDSSIRQADCFSNQPVLFGLVLFFGRPFVPHRCSPDDIAAAQAAGPSTGGAEVGSAPPAPAASEPATQGARGLHGNFARGEAQGLEALTTPLMGLVLQTFARILGVRLQ